MIAEQILAGQLRMPRITGLEEKFGTEVYNNIERMFTALWNAYLAKGNRQLPNGKYSNTVSMPYWAQQIANPKAHNIALKILSKAGWIQVSTRPNNNWSEAYLCESKLLNYVTQQQLDGVRMHNKFKKYKLELHNTNQDFGAYKMKINGRIHTMTQPQQGFAEAGKVPFRFDTDSMYLNYDLVLFEINKGIEKMICEYPGIVEDHANYREIGKDVVDSYIYQNSTYNSGPRTADPRKRNNAGYLNRIGNPVGFKVMRGLLVIPEEYRNTCTPVGLINKYLFIAELVGFKSGSTKSKIQFGRECYYKGVLAHEPVENIWLKRTYEDINNAFNGKFESTRYQHHLKIQKYKAGSAWHQARVPAMIDELVALENTIITKSTYKWQVPIEIDMSASVIGYLGLLLNHKPFLARTNMLDQDLVDAWGHPIITNRKQFKTIMRQCYGSQLSPQAMWDDMEIEYTKEEVLAFNHELENGEMAVANAFKDFIINNSKMQPEMCLNVLGDKVVTYCNKFHNVGEKTTVYDLFDSKTSSIRRIHNTQTKRVPDLKSFRRYGVTGLIHGLDGRVMNNTAEAVLEKYKWLLDVHDAAILCCESANYAREVYAHGRTPDEPSLLHIYNNRNRILSDYFTSLNIPANAISKWKKNVAPLIEPLDYELKSINPMVLK